MRPPREWPLLLAGPLLLGAPAARPDEATLRDGRRLPGKLTLDGKGWQFLPAGKLGPVPAADLAHVRLDTTTLAPLRAGPVQRVVLRDGGSLTGALLDLDARAATLRTAWADRVTLPRAAVAAVTHPPGWVAAFLEDFENDLKRWKSEGAPRLGDVRTSGLRGLSLAAGQAVEHTLSSPLAEGRAGVNVHDGAGAAWAVEAEFRTPGGPRTVTVAGEGTHYEADVPGLDGRATRVPRSAGWHRLTVQFTPSSLRVLVDEAVLRHDLDKGPGGPLVRWRMTCRKTGAPVSFDEFAVHRAVDEPRRPDGDATQDEVWLLDGDQLFGRQLRADGVRLVLEGHFGRRTFPWTAARGAYLRREAVPPGGEKGERVRVWIENGFAGHDELEGEVLSLDDRRCRLRHAHLGEVSLERGRVARILWDRPGAAKD